jgi:inorganic pyrophosphatase/exopolyphosphatase
MKTIVTAGAKGADIDVFACAIAYAELLTLEGKEAIAVVCGSFTASVTPSLLNLNAPYETTYTSDGSEQFVLVDISEPKHFAPFVAHEQIHEVYDHRYGYQDYWKEKLLEHSHIEMVGSCGTLIWEEYKKRNQKNQISSHSAKLLLASVVSNNLALKSELTTDRDILAYNELMDITGLNEDWVSEYYREQEKILFTHFTEYVEADTKRIDSVYGEFVISQIEVWNAESLLDQFGDILEVVMSRFEPSPWVVNIINVGLGYNYFFSNHEVAKTIMEESFGVSFEGNFAKTDKLLMRKYLMKVLQT